MIQKVEWDSLHFNMNVGIYHVPTHQQYSDLKSLEEEAKSHHYDVVYIRSKSPIIELERRHTFRDERLVYAKNIIKRNSPLIIMPQKEILHSVSIWSFENKEISEELIQLALASGEYSRYKLDGRFDKGCFEMLYKNWINNSVNKEFATDILVAYVNGKEVGLLTHKISDNTSTIGLLAVAATHREMHIGKQLMLYYQESLQPEVTTLKVVTQGANKIARRYYESCGYTIENTSYTYHLWI